MGVERSAARALEIFEGEAELGQNLLVRNALAAVEGGPSSGDLAGLCLRDWLIVYGGVGETSRDGVEHSFKQTDDGGNLARSQTLDQFVGVFLGVGHTSSP